MTILGIESLRFRIDDMALMTRFFDDHPGFANHHWLAQGESHNPAEQGSFRKLPKPLPSFSEASKLPLWPMLFSDLSRGPHSFNAYR